MFQSFSPPLGQSPLLVAFINTRIRRWRRIQTVYSGGRKEGSAAIGRSSRRQRPAGWTDTPQTPHDDRLDHGRVDSSRPSRIVANYKSGGGPIPTRPLAQSWIGQRSDANSQSLYCTDASSSGGRHCLFFRPAAPAGRRLPDAQRIQPQEATSSSEQQQQQWQQQRQWPAQQQQQRSPPSPPPPPPEESGGSVYRSRSIESGYGRRRQRRRRLRPPVRVYERNTIGTGPMFRAGPKFNHFGSSNRFVFGRRPGKRRCRIVGAQRSSRATRFRVDQQQQ